MGCGFSSEDGAAAKAAVTPRPPRKSITASGRAATTALREHLHQQQQQEQQHQQHQQQQQQQEMTAVRHAEGEDFFDQLGPLGSESDASETAHDADAHRAAIAVDDGQHLAVLAELARRSTDAATARSRAPRTVCAAAAATTTAEREGSTSPEPEVSTGSTVPGAEHRADVASNGSGDSQNPLLLQSMDAVEVRLRIGSGAFAVPLGGGDSDATSPARLVRSDLSGRTPRPPPPHSRSSAVLHQRLSASNVEALSRRGSDTRGSLSEFSFRSSAWGGASSRRQSSSFAQSLRGDVGSGFLPRIAATSVTTDDGAMAAERNWYGWV